MGSSAERTRERIQPLSRERASPRKVLRHGSAIRQETFPRKETAAPDNAASRAWLSLVGRAKRQASVPQRMTASSAAHSAARARTGSLPRSTREETVAATAPEQAEVSRQPSRLHPAASRTALP